jgi:hypothetical protein
VYSVTDQEIHISVTVITYLPNKGMLSQTKLMCFSCLEIIGICNSFILAEKEHNDLRK